VKRRPKTGLILLYHIFLLTSEVLAKTVRLVRSGVAGMILEPKSQRPGAPLCAWSGQSSINPFIVSVLIALTSLTAWSVDFEWRPGLENRVPFSPPVHSVMDFGAVGDGVADDSAAFQDALDSLPETGGVVLVPPGTYLLGSTIHLSDGAVLRGSGASNTHLRFDLGGRNDSAIEIVTYDRGPWVDAESGYQKGSTEIAVSNAASFTVPTFAEIQQTNDPSVMYTNPLWDQWWAQDAVGEIVRVVGRVDDRLTLKDPLRFAYDPAMNPIIRSQ